MTPFKIRRRIKKLLGMDAGASSQPVAPPLPSYDVTFECPDGSSYVTSAKEGDSLVLAAGRGPQPISTGCTDSTCGTCRVDVLAGHESLTEAVEHELDDHGREAGLLQRLGEVGMRDSAPLFHQEGSPSGSLLDGLVSKVCDMGELVVMVKSLPKKMYFFPVRKQFVHFLV